MSRRATDNLFDYLKGAVLPEMKLGPNAPSMPPGPTHKSHMNNLTVKPAKWRAFSHVVPFRDWPENPIDECEAVNKWIENVIPDQSLGIDDGDPETGLSITIPYPPRYGIPLVSERRPDSLARIVPWVDNLPLQTVQRIMHLVSRKDAEGWSWKHLANGAHGDEEIWKQFVWTNKPCVDPYHSGNKAGRRSLLLVLQPPWVLSEADIKAVAKGGTLLSIHGDGSIVDLRGFVRRPGAGRHVASSLWSSRERVWAKLWDACTTQGCDFFVLTSYHHWIFGFFSGTHTTAFITNVYPYNAKEPTIVERLAHWAAMAMSPGQSMADVDEPVGINIEEARRNLAQADNRPVYAASESDWDGGSSEAGTSPRVREMSPIVSDWGSDSSELPTPVLRPVCLDEIVIADWLTSVVEETENISPNTGTPVVPLATQMSGHDQHVTALNDVPLIDGARPRNTTGGEWMVGGNRERPH